MNHLLLRQTRPASVPRTLGARAPRRQRERGATVFVVMMAILLLSALGVWAMHAAGLVTRASGFGRAFAQTQYMAEMGLLTTTGYLSLAGMADANVQVGRKADTCISVGTGQFCKSILLEDVSQETNDLTTNTPTVTTAEGSFGAYADEVQGDFRVEMTDPVRAYLPGQALENAAATYYRVTLTGHGVVRPYAGAIAGGDICAVSGTETTAENSSAGRVGMRAHAIIGPVYNAP